MTEKKYSRFHKLVQMIAASRVGAVIFSGFLHRLDGACLKWSKGRLSVTEIFTGMPMILLTTTGARSGIIRTLPVLCFRSTDSPGTLAVAAANWGKEKMPSWYYNLKANPRISALFDGSQKTYIAHEASGEEYEHFWRIAEATFIGLSGYKKRVGQRVIPIMILCPESAG